MSAPQMTFGAEGGVLANVASLAAGAAATPVNVDLSGKFEGLLQVDVTYGTVASPPNLSGLRVEINRRIGTTPQADTIPYTGFTIPAVLSAVSKQSISLPTGRYEVRITNLDASNAVQNVNATMDTVDLLT